MEDIDTPRVVAGAAERIEEDLAWLGFTFHEGPREGGTYAPYTQSECTSIYDDALERLERAGLVYPCDCSRADIARVASAPHPGEETLYPGTCRDLSPRRAMKRAPALRLRIPAGASVAFEDLARGPFAQNLDAAVGDFVLRRGDGVYSYQLAVAVDDARMCISHVVRADDLLASTPRQILLMRLLGVAESEIPKYVHVPMVVAVDGARLAKRACSASIRELRARGITRDEIRTVLEEALGEGPPSTWRKEPWRVPPAWS